MTPPVRRPRRLRRTPAVRAAVAETRLHPADLVLPVFVKEGLAGPEPVGSMPGVSQHTPASAVELLREAASVGVRSTILFGIPSAKDEVGSGGWDPDGPVPTTARALKDALGDELVVWADVCSCEYTSHGHCGPLRDGSVVNDAAVEGYVREAVVYAEAGCDVVAPSGMMDGQVGAIRAGLDDAGLDHVLQVAYAVKYASAFYGPFRDAGESGMQDGGDRSDHQMDPANRREAIVEALLDVDQGADVLMVKPALPYLDVLREVRDAVDVPLAAYHVSGEYAMVKAAGERGWLDADAAMREAVVSIRRAGAGQVLTYAAVDLARDLHG